ncbi:MAG: hypothetical protein QOJ16_1510 [Acidobacteriota bacterium]|jgi:hypothetical protein|nr:hypothetical protein [Acidobacteriota bacterium]
MHGFPRRLLAAALLAVGLTAAANAAELPVRLLAPGDGTVLAAGSTASLEWTPLDALARPERWEEWEAFLSLDGGATYPVRITPHLDRELRRVTWKVPSLPTRNARLLLRVGDERWEDAFELPQRFTISAAPGSFASALDLPRTVGWRGEPARPGESGVRVWVEGSRRGGATREVVATEPARAVPSVSFPEDTPAPAAVAAAAPPSGSPAADPGVPSTLPSPRTGGTAHPRTPRPGAADLLLLIQRQNE